ncbi:unnamed protein product [Malus baccata var. baccata]
MVEGSEEDPFLVRNTTRRSVRRLMSHPVRLKEYGRPITPTLMTMKTLVKVLDWYDSFLGPRINGVFSATVA